MKKQHVIIYLPNGTELQYSTDKLVTDGDFNIVLCEVIACDSSEVMIREIIDGKPEHHSFVRMPYYLNTWD